jgi:hypothetical protein
MATITSPSGLSEVGLRGNEIYAQDLKMSLEPFQLGRFVAIDVTTRRFALGDSVLKASDELQSQTAADPENIWIVRIGSEAVYRLSRMRA